MLTFPISHKLALFFFTMRHNNTKTPDPCTSIIIHGPGVGLKTGNEKLSSGPYGGYPDVGYSPQWVGNQGWSVAPLGK
jgi:hypothetical protein